MSRRHKRLNTENKKEGIIIFFCWRSSFRLQLSI